MGNYDSEHQIRAGIAAAVVLLLATLPLSMQIQNVTAIGSDRYFAKQVEELLFTGRWGKSSVHAYFSDKFRPHIRTPFVEGYRVVFHNPPNVEVIVYERSIVEYMSYMSSFTYLNKNGIVVESLGSQLSGVPWTTDMEFGRIVLHRPLPVDDKNIFEEVLSLTQQLSVYDIAVDRIQYDSRGQATLFIGVMEVTIGNHTDIGGEISTPNGILKAQPQFTEINGIMKLDNCSESSSRTGITFKRE